MTLTEKFIRFHDANPHVYDAIVDVSRRWKAAGHSKWSVWSAINIVRWEHRFERDPEEQYKISNDYAALYSRMIMGREPDLNCFFDVKRMTRA